MSAYPLMLDGDVLTALVVGGGSVATRKVRSLLDAGAVVHVVAPDVSAELREMELAGAKMRITRSSYSKEL
ncbi:MAG TPA: NAD(P)-dependent oxidoreductase, partial [Gemmatimonadaceae bacterium]|nr:NAD(P)-dependent oxidoreductase [Gemmatimonadaceae bacterium]